MALQVRPCDVTAILLCTAQVFCRMLYVERAACFKDSSVRQKLRVTAGLGGRSGFLMLTYEGLSESS